MADDTTDPAANGSPDGQTNGLSNGDLPAPTNGSPADGDGGVAVVERIEDLNIERELQDSYLTYAMSTIMDRALPDVRDGLKPSQRRILVAMHDLKLGPRSKHYKCAKICGDTSGNYHPHGDQIVYPTLVRLGQEWNLRHTLVDPQGNFGSTDGDPPAASRYTEARMTAEAMELLADLDLDTVDYQPNYDERLTEPVVLPGKFPNLLVNGSTGIAVGMACNLLPHNLGEICDGIVHVMDHPDCSIGELMQIVPGPDFPTGGIICGRDGIVEGYTGGRGRLTLRAKTHVEQNGKGRQIIVVDELPYGVIRKGIIGDIANAVKAGNITDVADANDHSGRQHKCRIVVDLKRDADADVVTNQLFQYTACQITVSLINIAIVDRRPRTLGLKPLMELFIAHRRVVIARRTRFLLRKAQQRGHILEGLIYAVVDIDEVIRLIKTSPTREEAIDRLRRRGFQIPADHPYAPQIPRALLDRARAGDADAGARLSQAQAEAIGRLQLIQLVGLEIEKLTAEYREVVAEIEGYELILGDPARVTDIIREDCLEMKAKYADARRTEISGAVSGYNLEALITPEDVVVTVSHAGYVKRLPADTYRSQGRGGRGIKGTGAKEGDFVEHLFVANTHDHLLFFTNAGRAYVQRVFDVPEGSRTSSGRSVAQLLSFQPGEKIARVLAVKNLGSEEAYLLFATKLGQVKKTVLSAYANIRSNGINAINLADGDELIGVEVTRGDDEILLGTKKGMAVRFNEDSDKGGLRPTGRVAGGVKGVNLAKGDEVVALLVVPNSETPVTDTADPANDGDGDDSVTDEATDGDEPLAVDAAGPMVLVLTENGYGKRTPVGEYRLTRRAGKGVRNIKMTRRNGAVVGMLVVDGSEDVMLITEKGILIRTAVEEIGAYSRGAAGVRVIRIDDGDQLVAMAKADAEEKPTDKPPIPGDTGDRRCRRCRRCRRRPLARRPAARQPARRRRRAAGGVDFRRPVGTPPNGDPPCPPPLSSRTN